jgi:hypothetical protein
MLEQKERYNLGDLVVMRLGGDRLGERLYGTITRLEGEFCIVQCPQNEAEYKFMHKDLFILNKDDLSIVLSLQSTNSEATMSKFNKATVIVFNGKYGEQFGVRTRNGDVIPCHNRATAVTIVRSRNKNTNSE